MYSNHTIPDYGEYVIQVGNIGPWHLRYRWGSFVENNYITSQLHCFRIKYYEWRGNWLPNWRLYLRTLLMIMAAVVLCPAYGQCAMLQHIEGNGHHSECLRSHSIIIQYQHILNKDCSTSLCYVAIPWAYLWRGRISCQTMMSENDIVYDEMIIAQYLPFSHPLSFSPLSPLPLIRHLFSHVLVAAISLRRYFSVYDVEMILFRFKFDWGFTP